MSRYSVDIPFRSFDKYTPIPKYDIIDWDNNSPVFFGW